MADKNETQKTHNWNWFQARLRTKLWTAAAVLLSLYTAFFAYAFFDQHVNLFDLGQLGLTKYGNNQAEVLRNIIWSYGLLIGGMFAVLGFVNAIHRTQQKDRELDAAEARLHIEQTSERRKTDAEIFAKSVEQLGHDKMAIRLGGLYSLKNLARNAQALPLDAGNKAFLNSVLETLAAFVRMHTPIPPKGEQNNTDKVASDVEACIHIISHTFRFELRETINSPAVDLRDCYLPKLEMLNGADMQYFHFYGTELKRASLTNANLTKTSFYDANLTGARLYGATLTEAILGYANLTGVGLNHKDGFEQITGWTEEQFNNCIWSSDQPPTGYERMLPEDLQSIIDARTDEILEKGLWEKYLAERDEDEGS